jgi:hypothetical protein
MATNRNKYGYPNTEIESTNKKGFVDFDKLNNLLGFFAIADRTSRATKLIKTYKTKNNVTNRTTQQ